MNMTKIRNLAQATKANLLYQRAEDAWQMGRLRSAFRLFLAAAKAGNADARAVVGQFYDEGVGTSASKDAALYWYRLAYRAGSALAANNLGVIWRERGEVKRALMWFLRALELGDEDANLEIAKLYLDMKSHPEKAVLYLRNACKAKFITEGSKEEARNLLEVTKKGGFSSRSGVRGTSRTL
jgi:TPR repeat protein